MSELLQDKLYKLQVACKAGTLKQVDEQQKKQNEEDRILREKREMKSIVSTSQPPPSAVNSPAPHPWHKDFKIAGQIGEPGQKDELTFSSLARQIEHGLSKGFPELEIVDAVIRAISAGMQLRSYLEGKASLHLPTLRRILRCHYQEKSATELYKQLTSEVQGIKETPQSFLIRTFDLRQKILFTSQED